LRYDLHLSDPKTRKQWNGAVWFPCDPQGWIRVEDGVPPNAEEVIAWWEGWGSAKFDGKKWCDEEGESVNDPWCWQPGPGAPVGEGDTK